MTARAQRRRARIADWWASAWRWVLMAAGAAVSVVVLLNAGAGNSAVAAGAIAVLVIGAAFTSSKPMAIALILLPALFVVERVGLSGVELSVSDVALAAAFGTCVLLAQRPFSPPLRVLLWLNLFYQFTTLFTVIVNPYAANTVEWFHAWLLISGALVIGWALGRAGYARLALSTMVVTACVVAVGTLLTALPLYASGQFIGVYPQIPFPMHKNAAGTLMSFAAIAVYVNPGWIAWSRRWVGLSFWLLIAGILATQSRQALIGLLVAILVVALRRGGSRHSRYVLLLIIPGLWLVAVTVFEQVESQNQHNSVFQRLNWFREVYALWKHSPLFGHGLRYWYTDTTAAFQPPQAELEVLASAGIVGLVGFAVMWLGIIVVLWRVDPRYGTLALAVTLARITQAQFDLFWVAAQVSVPFVIAGICLGAMAHDEQASSSEGAALGGVSESSRARPDRSPSAQNAP